MATGDISISGQRTIDGFLTMSTIALQAAGINSARLDSELIATHVLNKPREYMLAHGDEPIDKATWEQLCLLLARRVAREPLAYLIGYKEFYGRRFTVTPDVLIPRPESEQIIDYIKSLAQASHRQGKSAECVNYQYLPCQGEVAQASLESEGFSSSHSLTLADVGTGSGCLAITAKLECPRLDVIASDVSTAALAVAKDNARRLNADISFIGSDLLANYPIDQPIDILVANLPYLDKSWNDDIISPELDSEPALALYAADHGCDLIKKLLFAAPPYLADSAQVILELDPRQERAIVSFAQSHHYLVVRQQPFMLVLAATK